MQDKFSNLKGYKTGHYIIPKKKPNIYNILLKS